MNFPFDKSEPLLPLFVKIKGPKRTTRILMALDTGATTTVLQPDLLEFVGYDLAVSNPTVQVTTGSGTEKARRLEIESIEALGATRKNFKVLAMPLPEAIVMDGLLGLDFLRPHRLLIDFPQGMISLD